VRIIHGKSDQRAPFSRAEALRKALDNRKYPYEWLTKGGEGHGFYLPEDREEL
jgi:dipeptidyl aminopeptidase/acylaminoacyl peptidase